MSTARLLVVQTGTAADVLKRAHGDYPDWFSTALGRELPVLRAHDGEKLDARALDEFKPDGILHAGNSSQITDGAAAILLMSREKARELGLRPRATLRAQAVVGVDPVTMLKGPIPATTRVLARAGMTIEDVDLFEVNEAFAPVVLAWQREHDPDMERVNVNHAAARTGAARPAGGAGDHVLWRRNRHGDGHRSLRLTFRPRPPCRSPFAVSGSSAGPML